MQSPIIEDGYPSEETLDAIAAWPVDEDGTYYSLLDFCREAWTYPDRWVIGYHPAGDGRQTVYCSTGGWSGNEDIVGALMQNKMFWLMCWRQSSVGGAHVFTPDHSAPDCRVYERNTVFAMDDPVVTELTNRNDETALRILRVREQVARGEKSETEIIRAFALELLDELKNSNSN